eukprot:Awhi_evm1s10501
MNTGKVLADLSNFTSNFRHDNEDQLLNDGFIKGKIDEASNFVPMSSDVNAGHVSLQSLVEEGILTVASGKKYEKRNEGEAEFDLVGGGLKNIGSSHQQNFEEFDKKITMSRSGTAGLVRFHDYPIFVAYSAIVLGLKSHQKKLLPEYLYHVLKLQQDKVMQLAKDRGTAQATLTISNVLEMVVELPSLEIQIQKL